MSAKVKVLLSQKDWLDVVNFVRGDLANMDDSEIKTQMTKICKEIETACIKALLP